MILFILEGKKQEPRIYKTIQQIYFRNRIEDEIIVSYCSNIFSLFNKMKEYDSFDGGADIVKILKLEQKENPEISDSLLAIEHTDSFSEIYLFFDYDLQRINKYNTMAIEEQNNILKQMLEYFSNETDKGKLYINYPMIESLRYFKKSLPDEDYYKYTSKVFDNISFKQKCSEESYYKNFDFIALRIGKGYKNPIINDKSSFETIKQNWKTIIDLNVIKANYICCDELAVPGSKEYIAQERILANQINKYLQRSGEVSILNSFPLFIYEYFKRV